MTASQSLGKLARETICFDLVRTSKRGCLMRLGEERSIQFDGNDESPEYSCVKNAVSAAESS